MSDLRRSDEEDNLESAEDDVSNNIGEIICPLMLMIIATVDNFLVLSPYR
jgi:hypothetical protein